jgi:hypothetical protein
MFTSFSPKKKTNIEINRSSIENSKKFNEISQGRYDQTKCGDLSSTFMHRQITKDEEPLLLLIANSSIIRPGKINDCFIRHT